MTSTEATILSGRCLPYGQDRDAWAKWLWKHADYEQQDLIVGLVEWTHSRLSEFERTKLPPRLYGDSLADWRIAVVKRFLKATVTDKALFAAAETCRRAGMVALGDFAVGWVSGRSS